MLQYLALHGNNIAADINNLVGWRPPSRFINKLVLKVALWVASAVASRVELWDDAVVLPPALAAHLVLPPSLSAVLAAGDELLDLVLPGQLVHWHGWRPATSC
jgi:hypothetical protein